MCAYVWLCTCVPCYVGRPEEVVRFPELELQAVRCWELNLGPQSVNALDC